jgi:hypothetical protein
MGTATVERGEIVRREDVRVHDRHHVREPIERRAEAAARAEHVGQLHLISTSCCAAHAAICCQWWCAFTMTSRCRVAVTSASA